MCVVQKMYELTEQLVTLLDSPVTKDNRETVIHTITSLLEQRETMMKDLKEPYTDEEKLLGKQIIEWNKKISVDFKNLKNQVQKDITQLKTTKATQNKYVNPYENVNTDGMYYDKKK